MLDYVDSKERQGVFFEKPTEKIHLPEPAELALMDHSKSEFRQSFNFLQIYHYRGIRSCGSGELHSALIKGYSQMTKESNSMTGQPHDP